MSEAPVYHAPGIYLGMPFQEYLSDPALSNSGIQNLRVSPLTYWINSPLNPDFEPNDTEAKETGKAFHTRILEGQEAFLAAYAPEISPADYPDALKSGEDLRAACEGLGLKKSGTLAEMSARIREVEKGVQLWVEIEKAHQQAHEGKTFLSARTISQIELAASAIEANPALAALFSNGFAEVSIFWVDERTGVHMKARLDYLTLGTITDLKTFSNSQDKPLAQAVANAIASYGYGVQVVTYLEALVNAKRMLRDLGMQAVHFDESLVGAPFDFDGWFSKLAKVRDHRFVFVFQETGRVPNVAIREFGRNTNYFDIMRFRYEWGVQLYKDCVERWGYGTPWVEPAELDVLEDEDFPLWAFN